MPSINSPTPDATTTTKGKIQLAGDLGGTAAAPTINNGAVGPSKLATGATSANIATLQATTSTAYTDLTTVGPSVTVTIGNNGAALVCIEAWGNEPGGAQNYASYAVSGATTIAAADTKAMQFYSTVSSSRSFSHVVTGLTPGSNTFSMKYRTGAGNGNYSNRTISVIPL